MKFNWKKGTPILWEEFTWEEVEEFVDHCNMVIIPVGAIEQHGPHLPLMTDTAQALDPSWHFFPLTVPDRGMFAA